MISCNWLKLRVHVRVPIVVTDVLCNRAQVWKQLWKNKVRIWRTGRQIPTKKSQGYTQGDNSFLGPVYMKVGDPGQVGEVTCGGLPHLICKRDHIKMTDYMDRRVTHLSGLSHLPGVHHLHVNRPLEWPMCPTTASFDKWLNSNRKPPVPFLSTCSESA